ncbi:MAG: CaiB/BaiF CoA-transferase family protein [Candidatus Rokubacteria bacterium]|nr:CaiB/BaiF CoA-transferase family protein [Candidatus Rokubacteria bacterium]
MTLPLANVRITDFTIMMQGPHATQMLADLGAEVIKVERPHLPGSRPDVRYGLHGGYGKTQEDSTFMAATFLAHNRNKKSIRVDLRQEKGKAIVRRLLKTSDVVYQNFRPGVMARLGFGYDDCCKINPSIIYASATGYGPDGPYVHKPGQDLLAQALGGFDAVNATADGRPMAIGFSISDLMGAVYGAVGVLAALYHRQLTGEGQQVDVSLLDGTIAALSEVAVHFLNTGIEPQRGTPMHACPYLPTPYGIYRTKDGYITISGGHKTPALSKVLGLPNLADDPRFDTDWKRDQNRAEMERIIEQALSRKTTAEWLSLMEKEDLWVAPVRRLPEVFNDPQVLHNDMVVTVQSPIGPLKLPGVPYKLSKTPAQVRTAPPTLGQHTEEILKSIGYSQEEIAALEKEHVV